MLGLFEGDWLGVVVGCDHMNMNKLDEQDKNVLFSDGNGILKKKYTRYVQATLTSFDGDVEGPMLGLFEGDWLGP